MPKRVGDDGFVALFNGKDLAGWKAVGEPKWSWADGRLLGSPAPGGGPGFLVTEAKYEDFELKMQYRLAIGAGSGLFLRADASGPLSGKGQFEVQIADDDAYKLGPLVSTGAIYNVFPRKFAPSLKRGDWNDLRVRLTKRHIEVWINGIQTIDADLDTAGAKLATVPGLTRRSGGIGLQQNQKSDVEFRNLRVKVL
jgi:3-keto-disaccharide hydrolase